MNILKIVILLFLTTQNAFGQFTFNNIDFYLKNPPLSSYKILQTENGKLKRILEFNKDGKIIFDYREAEIPPFYKWTEPHRFIYANEFDTTGRVIKKYDFNSNAGLIIYSYEYGLYPLTQTLFKQEYPKSEDFEQNTNAYAFISKYQNFEALKKSNEVAIILSSARIKISTEKFNRVNLPMEVKEYSSIYGDTIVTSIEYNQNGEEQSKKVIGLSNNEIKREVSSEFKHNSKITEIVNYYQGAKTSTYRFATLKNENQNTTTEYSERNGTLNIRHYQYDKDGYLSEVNVFEMAYKGELIIPISSDLNKTSEMIYKYNKQGLLEKEVMTNFKTGQKDTRRYDYEIVVD